MIKSNTASKFRLPIRFRIAGHKWLVDTPILHSSELFEGRVALLLVISIQDCTGGPQLNHILIPLACGGFQLRYPETIADRKPVPPQPPAHFIQAAITLSYLT